MNTKELLYYNGFGGFSKDGNEYIICTSEKYTPAPWSHIMANEKFGTLVTANGGGYVWSHNSRDNKLTSWSNDPITDKPSEVLQYDCEEKSYNLLPYDSLENFTVEYGFGYARFFKEGTEIDSNINIFVPRDECKKVYNITLKNKTDAQKELNIRYKIEPVLGVSREYTKKHLVISKKENGITINNYYRENYANETMYVSSNEVISDIEVLDKTAQISINIMLGAFEEKSFVIEIGTSENLTSYEIIQNPKEKLEEVKNFWKDFVSRVKVRTPVESMNIMMNGWLLYQTVTSRLWARTSFYQASGAFGFRDQLQDSLILLYYNPEMTKKQIIYHAKHQFIEGDVLHWWHPEKDNGIRTRYTDDLLWLPYVLYEYIAKEKDYEILDENVPYVKMTSLSENENERYDNVEIEEKEESLYMHAKRAIERSLSFGEHGLPRMSGGDWNDGMNNVKGESIWLRIFSI